MSVGLLSNRGGLADAYWLRDSDEVLAPMVSAGSRPMPVCTSHQTKQPCAHWHGLHSGYSPAP